MAKYTPMMEQYLEIKEQYKDCILFFRLGDFYEMFFDDALTASKELEIALTGKGCGQEDRAPMCGVPYHSSESYISKLVEKGYKVAVCEQVEDPKQSKSIVKRDVVRIVTAGTLLDSNVLEEGKNNFIACIFEGRDGYGFAVCDVSTGEFLTTEFSADRENAIIDEIAKYNPTEIICNEKLHMRDSISSIFETKVEVFYDWAFDYQDADIRLCNHFKTLNLSGFGLDKNNNAVCASGALMQYLLETQKNSLSHISNIKIYFLDNFMLLDLSSRKNLELTKTARDGSKKGSLLWVLDKTKTAMGSRLLRKWIEQPLLDKKEIDRRLDSVEKFKEDVLNREEIKEVLNTIFDIERIMGKIVYATANGKDMLSLKNSFVNLPYIKQLLENFSCEYIDEIHSDFDSLEDLYSILEAAIDENAPFSVREGGIIKDGYNAEVDRLREAKKKGDNWIKELVEKEREATGIKSLKKGFNKVFGFYIEVSNSYTSLVPNRFIRKQTLSNCERYITPELKELEETILGAEEKVVELEYSIFSKIRDGIASEIERIQKTAYFISVIDVFQSLGEVADKNSYVKPVIINSGEIEIYGGRHPVVEQIGKESFIPNDTILNTDDKRLSIITGPNMAGKSTYMRQTALLVIMAQLGSFVPADEARIGICDRVFTRVGASDDLATGQSTFMIEMAEVANILNNATDKSLLILDEIGRGTSTFDGLSIAWAVLEYIADKKHIGARTLFATHYHELTELEGKVDGVNNYCVAVQEKGEDIVFLRKIVRGGADKSYGIHVAKLAGVPDKVITRSQEILEVLSRENKENDMLSGDNLYYTNVKPARDIIIISEEIKNMDMDNLSPMEVFSKFYSIRERLMKL